MSTKSEVITMPALMKDEKKYAECVDVLDQLEKWTYNIYSAAGLCSSENPHSDDPAPQLEAALDQTNQPLISVLLHPKKVLCQVLKFRALETN